MKPQDSDRFRQVFESALTHRVNPPYYEAASLPSPTRLNEAGWLEEADELLLDADIDDSDIDLGEYVTTPR